MKKIITIFTVILLAYSGYAQQLVQNINDVYKLKENEESFKNKTLKDLLKEIKPEIKTANVFNEEEISVFLFKFTTLEQQRNREGNLLDRVTLLIYVKEFINWDWQQKPKGNEIIWTSNDAAKFGDFTIVKVGVVPYIE